MLALTLKRNMLKHHAGHTMFCPACNNILDARGAVELDFSQNGKLVKSKIVCAPCYDGTFKALLAGMKLPEGVTVEVNDGRVLFARPKRARKSKPARPDAKPTGGDYAVLPDGGIEWKPDAPAVA